MYPKFISIPSWNTQYIYIHTCIPNNSDKDIKYIYTQKEICVLRTIWFTGRVVGKARIGNVAVEGFWLPFCCWMSLSISSRALMSSSSSSSEESWLYKEWV